MTLTKKLFITYRVELHITQSREIGDILSAVANIPISKSLTFSHEILLNQVFNHNHTDGKGNFMTAVKVAQLSLKHRMNKNAKPRVVIFCGHPLLEE